MSSSVQKLSRRGHSSDRSVPPTFKYWTNGHKPKSQGKGKKEKSDVGASIPRAPSDNDWLALSRGILQRYLPFILMGLGAFIYKKAANQGHRVQMNVKPIHLRHSSIDEDAPRSRVSFIDSAWLGEDEIQFETLIPPSEIDFAIQRRLHTVQHEHSCDDILLFVPGTDFKHGYGAELNGYLRAAFVATYMDKAMVVLDPPPVVVSRNVSDSWFDCPIGDLSKSANERSKAPPHEDVASGLSRLIQHPQWLSRGCPVPCQKSYNFSQWNDLRSHNVQEVTCRNDNDRQVHVVVLSGHDARHTFDEKWKEQMLERPSEEAYHWALRLGARGYEAQMFAELQSEDEIWDFVCALMARSGIVRFQPWIARDIKVLIKMTELPLNWPYIAIHIYRQGLFEADEMFPAPFLTHLEKLRGQACNDRAYPVFVATDDPHAIQEEIDRLPIGFGGNIIMKEDCLKMRFIFNPVNPYTHYVDGKTDCLGLHRSKIAEMADLMILAKSDTHLGGFDSHYGWLLGVFRAAVNNSPR